VKADDHQAGVKGARRREAIYAAATRLFAERGYAQTSIQDIARDAGVLKGSLYYYVSSKEDLLYQLLVRNHESLYAHVVGQAPQEHSTALEAVHSFVRRHVDYVLAHADLSALYAQESAALQADERWVGDLHRLRRRHEDALCALLAAAVEAGEAVDDDVVMTTRAILSMANATHRWHRSSPRRPAAEIAEHHANLAVRAIRR
jgi:AcrR family transcriptional regulator